MNNKLIGYLLGAIAASSYGANPLFAIPLYRDGMNADSVLFFRYLFAIPMVALMIWARGRSFRMSLPSIFVADGKRKFDSGESLLAILMGLLMGFSSFSLFISYNFMDASIASTLLFVYPIMVAVLMAVVYHEKAGASTYLAVLLVCVGIGLLCHSGGGASFSLMGMVWVFMSALSYAVYIIGVKQSRLHRVATLTVTFYVLCVGFVLFALKVIVSGSLVVPHSVTQWMSCVALAFFPTALSFLCTTQAINIIGSTPTAILGALEPVTAVIIGVCVLGETLTGRSLLGLVVIITAVTIVIVGGRLGSHLTHFRRMFPSLRRKRQFSPRR